ncbi:MAG: DUF2357 domain-containing protein [Bacteroidota bacterium]
MIVLRLENTDLVLEVKCNGFPTAYRKAKERQRSFLQATSYAVEGLSSKCSLHFPDPAPSLKAIDLQEKYHPVFFENKNYFFGIRFKSKEIEHPHLYSTLQSIKDKFFLEPSIPFLSGTINFANDIGRTDFVVRYRKAKINYELKLSVEVFPTKLDYRKDHDQLVADIEAEYPLLVLDYLRKTYHHFKAGGTQKTDLIWWQIFGDIYEELIKAAQFILNKPHSRLIEKTLFKRAEQLKKMRPQLEEEYHRFKRVHPNRYYKTTQRILSTNTPENRFFKFAIFQVQQTFLKIRTFIEHRFSDKITSEFRATLSRIEGQLSSIVQHPFFRSIGPFKGLKQESLVLNKATGYNTLFKHWTMLNSGVQFLEGLLKLELKNIAELYQIWCFLEVKKILQNLLGKDQPDDIDLAQIAVDSFVFKIKKGVKSRVLYRLDDGQEVELFHDFRIANTTSDGMIAPTVQQQPDIVLRLTRQDLFDNYKLTYLYDAKYRLVSDHQDGAPDYPPDDAINQMHRYRDAIYYNNRDSQQLEKEVIGGYILFPGKGDPAAIQEMPYYNSIAAVNIGAFPLRPGDAPHKSLLHQHLRKLLSDYTEHHLQTISPPKEVAFPTFNATVLIGIVPASNSAQYQYFLDGDVQIYHTGVQKPVRFGYEALQYFAPYLAGKGIAEYYKIESYSLLRRRDIYPPDHPQFKADDSERLVLQLGQRRQIDAQRSFFQLASGSIQLYRYTDLYRLRNPRESRVEVI